MAKMAKNPRPDPILKVTLKRTEPIMKITRLNRYKEKTNGFLSLKPLKAHSINIEATIKLVTNLMIRNKLGDRLMVSMIQIVFSVRFTNF
jgi:hypothetical protein